MDAAPFLFSVSAAELTGRIGIFTYGSFSPEVLRAQTITLLDEVRLDAGSSGGIQVIDHDRRLFYIPSADRMSYYARTISSQPGEKRSANRWPGTESCRQ